MGRGKRASGRGWVGLLAICVAAGALASAGRADTFLFARDDVLGTSMTMTVVAADRPAAEAAERRALDEIERLNGVLSTYRPDSEISRLAAQRRAMRVSRDLIAVLDAAELWRQRSGGAFDVRVGQMIDLWRAAEKTGRPPDGEARVLAVMKLRRPAWKTDADAGAAEWLSDAAPNVDALAKGYIIDRALAAAHRDDPKVRGAMVEIGGDLATWGAPPDRPDGPPAWRVEVTDPTRPYDNAPALATLRLDGQAVATSGHYARFYTVQGKRYSHILDPRTALPVESVGGATVVAADATTADALATALCVLEPKQGLALARQSGAECLILAPDGAQHRSAGWAALTGEAPATAAAGETAPAADADAWPDGWGLTITLTLARQRHRPYVAVWIEDARGQAVRTVAVWGREQKYLKDLPKWWAIARQDAALKTRTSASRRAGQYALVWDGQDDAGHPLPPGRYTVRVETAAEKGPHTLDEQAIECTNRPAEQTVKASAGITELALRFGALAEGK